MRSIIEELYYGNISPTDRDIEKAYDIFENKLNGVIKIAIVNE